MIRVGIQGTHGSYHEQAARKHYGNGVEIAYLQTFQEVFEALLSGLVAEAVVAIANNRYGFVPGAFSELMRNSADVSIAGEVYLPIRHQLLALPGTTLESIHEVYSQSVALGQCTKFLRSTLAHARLVEEDDTARSAELVSQSGDVHMAAVASSEAAELYGLQVLAQNIQDDDSNITRFLVLKRASTEAGSTGDKTTALLRTSQAAGSLVDALMPFKEHGINISTLHSTFLPNTEFEMQFFIE
ncbi:hypothetical protein KC957_04070, partial [Candidatus Saccharibacteria bacterium]|nr:hypothetical protein [Candidatus Saccharibacteria bacterium]